MDNLAKDFLLYLGVKKQEPSLTFLNELVREHQLKVRWETVTKMIDWEAGKKDGEFLPPVEVYMKRMIQDGCGGTCWTVATGFHWLLRELGFTVHYLYMDPGHLCLRVDLDQPYFIDLGYCAPLFRAYPLLQSFTVSDARETFSYQVADRNIVITRTSGPTKVLNPEPINLQDLKEVIQKANEWETAFALQAVRVFGYVDGVLTGISNNTLKRYGREKEERELTEKELMYWVTEKFQMNPEVYTEAVRIYSQHKK
ncbi:arylamine N-acetyltransferase [Ectobacillus sp. JY-23]|uniref:arylamine N-acetyltransferase n=1 Tax=Ectobacillus sp. JY-23 TaxID=2933872 RepID=UPI001FF48381|nr:arylamine N-acetyltransferase [Ectobacillus sp. JY-23]UOY93351.1 arylamine N-acetyltransferase [Ectobacillus sp. JY-23]